MHISLDKLDAHPANSNRMADRLLDKLAAHIERTDRYPPIIVRPHGPRGDGRYQILDGHHRVAALRRLERDAARCDVWHVDDGEALLLLATLNRLQGRDDPHRRAALLAQLRDAHGETLKSLAAKLPERPPQVQALFRLNASPPAPQPAPPLDDMPRAVHFFLSGGDRRRLLQRLADIHPRRETALMTLLDGADAALDLKERPCHR